MSTLCKQVWHQIRCWRRGFLSCLCRHDSLSMSETYQAKKTRKPLYAKCDCILQRFCPEFCGTSQLRYIAHALDPSVTWCCELENTRQHQQQSHDAMVRLERKSVVYGKSGSVRVALGGRGVIHTYYYRIKYHVSTS